MSYAVIQQLQTINSWTQAYITSTPSISVTRVTPTATTSVWYQQPNTSTTGGCYQVPTLVHDTQLRTDTEYELPDGSKLKLDDKGNYQIIDKDAKVVYQASRVRDFNQFLNASDLIEEYILELAPLGIRQDEVLQIKIEDFIHWLIHKAAEKDQDTPPADIPKLPDTAELSRKRLPRCGCCGRFIRRAWVSLGVQFCSPLHMARKLERSGALGESKRSITHEFQEKSHAQKSRQSVGKGRYTHRPVVAAGSEDSPG